MFQKRISKKVDLMDGIGESMNVPPEGDNLRLTKKIKLSSSLPGQT